LDKEKISILFKSLNENEREPLEKILTIEEIELWNEIQNEWVEKLRFFVSIDSIRKKLGLKYDQNKVKGFYTKEDVIWFIHKYWKKPKDYLRERLTLVRDAQLWLLNIYSAILTVGLLGTWLLFLSYCFQSQDIALFLIILIPGIITMIFNRIRRRITLFISDKFIRGNLNQYDIESYVIAKILDKKEKSEKINKQ
jgi:hypothetical protein